MKSTENTRIRRRSQRSDSGTLVKGEQRRTGTENREDTRQEDNKTPLRMSR